MATRYEKLTTDREALIDLIENSSVILKVDAWYCTKVCPHNERDCVDCIAPLSDREQINLWLDENV